MTDIEQALAEELWGQGIEGWAVVIRDDVKEPTPAQSKLAAALASSPSMQTIARQAAIGAAVERAADAAWHHVIEYDRRIGYDIQLDPEFHGQSPRYGYADTLPAAIAAALGDDDR